MSRRVMSRRAGCFGESSLRSINRLADDCLSDLLHWWMVGQPEVIQKQSCRKLAPPLQVQTAFKLAFSCVAGDCNSGRASSHGRPASTDYTLRSVWVALITQALRGDGHDGAGREVNSR
jgi:hypothetical protein